MSDEWVYSDNGKLRVRTCSDADASYYEHRKACPKCGEVIWLPYSVAPRWEQCPSCGRAEQAKGVTTSPVPLAERIATYPGLVAFAVCCWAVFANYGTENFGIRLILGISFALTGIWALWGGVILYLQLSWRIRTRQGKGGIGH